MQTQLPLLLHRLSVSCAVEAVSSLVNPCFAYTVCLTDTLQLVQEAPLIFFETLPPTVLLDGLDPLV